MAGRPGLQLPNPRTDHTAIEHHQQALAIARETGNRDGEAACLGGLADSYATLGQTTTAIEHYQQALAIDRETGNRDGEADSLGGLAYSYATWDRPPPRSSTTSRPWPPSAKPATVPAKPPA